MSEQNDEVLVEELTKAVLFEDCGNTTDWQENLNLGRAILPILHRERASARSDAYAEATPLVAEAHDLGFAKGRREGIEEAAEYLDQFSPKLVESAAAIRALKGERT